MQHNLSEKATIEFLLFLHRLQTYYTGKHDTWVTKRGNLLIKEEERNFYITNIKFNVFSVNITSIHLYITVELVEHPTYPRPWDGVEK